MCNFIRKQKQATKGREREDWKRGMKAGLGLLGPSLSPHVCIHLPQGLSDSTASSESLRQTPL